MRSIEVEGEISGGRCIEPPPTFTTALVVLNALLEEKRETNRRLSAIEALLKERES